MNEIKKDLSFEKYLALDRYGSSDLRAMRMGPPALVKWHRENREETEATKLGTACHSAVLTPFLYSNEYSVKPEDMTFASKEGKAWKAAHADKKIISFDNSEIVSDVVAAFFEKKAAQKSLESALGVEDTVLWTCEASGLRCKGRPDWYDAEAVLDFKVSRYAVRGESIAYRAYTEGWMHQLAHNRAGLAAAGITLDRGRLVVISPKPPHYVQLVEVKMDALDLLELENVRTRKAIFECEKADSWPGTPDDWRLIEPPPSALVESFGVLEGVEVSDV